MSEDTIILTVPPSVNHAYVRTRFGMALSKKAKDWKILSHKMVQTQLKGWECCDDKVILDIWVWWQNRRRRDLDNILKLTMDSLSGIVYTDDKWAIPRFQDFGFDKANPRVVIKVRRFEDDCIQPTP